MEMVKKILYIHGMGGGGDSRIPGILQTYFYERRQHRTNIEVIVRTYSFDPEEAASQINDWIHEILPDLIIGESLGAIQAIRIKGFPHILVSPSLGAPKYLGYLAFLALIPGVSQLLNFIYRPKEGDRQKMDFRFKVLRKYRHHRKLALDNTPLFGSKDYFFAFFGTKDHYRKTGVVSMRAYIKYFGNSYQLYEGTHFMEENFIYEKLVPKIIYVLGTGL